MNKKRRGSAALSPMAKPTRATGSRPPAIPRRYARRQKHRICALFDLLREEGLPEPRHGHDPRHRTPERAARPSRGAGAAQTLKRRHPRRTGADDQERPPKRAPTPTNTDGRRTLLVSADRSPPGVIQPAGRDGDTVRRKEAGGRRMAWALTGIAQPASGRQSGAGPIRVRRSDTPRASWSHPAAAR
jgi:hypothetical protein